MANPIVNIILAAVDKTKAAFGSVKGGLSSIGEVSGNLKSVLGSLFVGLSVAGFVSSIKRAANEIDDAKKAAEGAGTSLGKFSALSYASGQSGGGPEVLQKALVKLAQGLRSSQDEGSKAAALFRDLRIDPRQFSDSSDALLALADRFQSMPAGIAKTNLAVDLFGEKIGPRMIPLLNEGAAGIRALMEEGRRLGKVFDDDIGAAAENFNDNMERLKKAGEGLGIALSKKLLPELAAVTQAAADAAEKGGLLSAIWATIKFGATDFLSNQDLTATYRLQSAMEQLNELRKDGFEEDSKRIVQLQQWIPKLQAQANAEKTLEESRRKSSKDTVSALGKDYETDASNFKNAINDKVSDAKRLQDALRSAFEGALSAQKGYQEEADRLASKAAGGLTAGKSQESLQADGAIAAMKLNRLATSSGTSAEEIRAQAAAVRELAGAINDQAQSQSLMQQADKGESVAARLQAAEAGKQAAALAEQMRANEARMNEAATAAEGISKTPIVPQVDGTQVGKLLADLADVEAAIGRVNGLKIAPGYGAGAVGDSMQEALRKAALQHGRRN